MLSSTSSTCRHSSRAAPPERCPPSRGLARSRRADGGRSAAHAAWVRPRPDERSYCGAAAQLSHARRLRRARSAAPLTRTARCCLPRSVCVVSAALPPCGQTFVKATVGHLKEKSARVRALRRASTQAGAPGAHQRAGGGARRAYRSAACARSPRGWADAPHVPLPSSTAPSRRTTSTPPLRCWTPTRTRSQWPSCSPAR